MRYHDITKDDMKNGDGLRVVLWVAGCIHHCQGCQNPCTWDPNGGLEFDTAAEQELFSLLARDYHQGITFSGGDPLHPANRKAVGRLIRKIKAQMPEKDIWLYTGYRLDDNLSFEFVFDELRDIDVVVDGVFNLSQRMKDVEEGLDPHWCGDSTQRVIDIKVSLMEGRLIRKEEIL